MPAVNSKEEGDKLTERQARLLKQVKHLIFLNLSAWLMMIPARPEMVLRVTQGDALKTAQILGSMTGGAALFEFLVTPAMGRITDKYGRKPVRVVTTSCDWRLCRAVPSVPCRCCQLSHTHEISHILHPLRSSSLAQSSASSFDSWTPCSVMGDTSLLSLPIGSTVSSLAPASPLSSRWLRLRSPTPSWARNSRSTHPSWLSGSGLASCSGLLSEPRCLR